MSEEKKTAVTEEVKEEARKLTEEELEQVTGGSNVSTMLKGKVAGVEITSDGQPGATATVRVRGASSITASSEPLYVVD